MTPADAAAEVAELVTDLQCAGLHSEIYWLATLCRRAAALLARTEAARELAAFRNDVLLRDFVERGRLLATAEREREELRAWIDSNTTFYDVDADWPVEGPNIPTLAQVSARIWYHATDDISSYPLSAVAARALSARSGE